MKNKLSGCGFAFATSILLWIMIIALFASCKTSEQLYTKAKVKDIVKVAELARIDFPCTTTKIDSVITIDTLYDFIEVDCAPVINTRVDTVTNTVTVKVPRQLVTIRSLLKVEDSAKILIMQAVIADANATIIAEQTKVNEYKAEAQKQRKSKNWWRKWCLITWGLIAAGIAFRLLRSKIGL